MQLTIENESGTNLNDFADYLIRLIKGTISVDRNQLRARDEYLSTWVNNYKWAQIVQLAINNLYWYKVGSNYVITINDKVTLYKTDSSLFSLIKLLEYGNSEMPAYPIFNPTFEKIAEGILKEHQNYRLELGEV